MANRGGAVKMKFNWTGVLFLLIQIALWFSFFSWVSPIHALGYVATTTGNFNNATTWGGVGVPTAGDTGIINNGVTVTCPVSVTCIIGASPSNDTSTPALACLTTSGTGIFVNNGTFIYQGTIKQCSAAWVWGPGSTVTCDNSAAGTPSTALYTWTVGQVSSPTGAILNVNGTSGSHVTWNTTGVNCGGGGGGFTNAGSANMNFLDISGQGAATSTGALWNTFNNTGFALTMKNVTAVNSGYVDVTSFFSPGSFTIDIENSKFTKIVNTTAVAFILDATGTKTGGTRIISNNQIDGGVTLTGVSGVASGYVVTNNVITKTYASTASPFNPTNGISTATFDQNLFYIPGADALTAYPAGTVQHTYLFHHCDPAPGCANVHPIYFFPKTLSATWSNNIYEMDVTDEGGDTIEPAEATASATLTISYSLFLPNGLGKSIGSFVNIDPGVTVTNLKTAFTHNTMAGGNAGAGTQGVGCESSTTTTMTAGTIPTVTNNLLWRTTSGGAWLTKWDTPSCTVNASTFTTVDYNATWQVTGAIYLNPATSAYASTPGAHDFSANPLFTVDPTTTNARNIWSFDTGYLGHSVATAWVTATSYSVGDIRSFSNASFNGGATYNIECYQAHTSGSTTQPGIGANWAEYWRPASISYIEASVLAGQTFSGGTNSMIGELVKWVNAAYAPANSAVCTSANDGTYQGAVPCAITQSGFFSMFR